MKINNNKIMDRQFELKFFSEISEEKKDFQRIDYWEYCDNCGEKLVIHKCEFVCEKCGFFHSCSEP